MKKGYRFKPKWYLYVNCDCSSYHELRVREPGETSFRRCRYCNKQLGCMEWNAYPLDDNGKPIFPKHGVSNNEKI